MVDVIVVGGGPAGLNAAIVLGRARREVLLVDSGHGRNAAAKNVHNLLTRDGITPGDLRQAARDDLGPYESVRHVAAEITAVRGVQGDFAVTIDGEAESARRLILATGVRDILPEIAGISECWGTSVLHCPYCHGWEVRDRPLAVLVNDFFGVTTALRLANGFSNDVVACTNGSFSLDDGQRGMLADAGVGVHEDQIAKLESTGGELESIEFVGGDSLQRAALFVQPETEQASSIPRQLGCSLLEDGAVEVNDMQQTSVSGVYAAGDMARRESMPFGREQVGIAAADGINAAVFADQEMTFMP